MVNVAWRREILPATVGVITRQREGSSTQQPVFLTVSVCENICLPSLPISIARKLRQRLEIDTVQELLASFERCDRFPAFAELNTPCLSCCAHQKEALFDVHSNDRDNSESDPFTQPTGGICGGDRERR